MPGLKLDFVIKGAEELNRKLDPKNLLGKPLKALFSRAAFIFERQAKEFSPVRTGRLRASIGGGAYTGGTYPKGHGIEVSKDAFPLWAKVGTNVQYASFVELSPHVPRPGGVGQTHFWSAAIEATKGKLDTIRDEVSKLIEEHWRGR